MPIAKFLYNNIKNASIRYKYFKLNYKYHLYDSFKNDIDSYFKFKWVDKLVMEIGNLIAICRDNLSYIQE